ncbi:hypothetical protein D3C73_1297740 [compost metagenome]
MSRSITSASVVLSQNWYMRYGLHISASSQMALPSLLPNLVPSLFVISGVPMACTETPSARRMRSVPLVRLPHWSLPPVCSTQSYCR